MEDVITLKVSRQIIELNGAPVTILLSQTMDRRPITDLPIEEEYRKARRQGCNTLERRADDRYCKGCGHWRPLRFFDTYDDGHIAMCRSCTALYAQIPAGHKQCTNCFRVKPFEAYSPDRRMKLGLKSRCRTCESELVNRLQKEARIQERMRQGLEPRKPGRPLRAA